jgi:hypothetical protein
MRIRHWVFRTLQLALTCLMVALAVPVAVGQVRFFDMGTADSKLYTGATRVTADDVYAGDKGYGWQRAEELTEQARAYEEMGDRRGSPAPPVMWTNAVTEDCILGSSQNAFLVDVPAGAYRVYLLSGTSEAVRYFHWDFRVAAVDAASSVVADDGATGRVQIEGGLQHRPLRLPVTVTGGTLRIDLNPLSKWVVSCLLVAPEDQWERVEREIIEPLEQWTFFLPPHVREQWTCDPPPESEPLPDLSTADRDRGWVLFNRPWPEVVWHNTHPRAEEIDRELRLFASLGEYEPFTFCVHLLRDAGDLQVQCSDLGPVSADAIDIRHVRYLRARPNYVGMGLYRVVPDVLEPMWMFAQREIYDPAAAVELEAGTTHRFWLTVRVPADADPGIYTGHVTVRDDRGGAGRLPIRLRVLPIRLQEDSEKIWGMYYRHPLSNWRRADDEHSRQYWLRRAELEHQDLVNHGMRNIVINAWCPPANEAGQFEADWTELQRTLELCEQYGFRGPYATHINAGGIYHKHTGESWGAHTEDARVPPPGYAEELTAMTRFIESERKKYGWPEFLYYPVDEPGRHEASVKLMRITLQAIQAAGAPTYVTAAPEHEQFQPLKPFVNVWCTQTFLPDRETVLADMAARDVQYWCYPNKSCGENDHTTVRGARMTYGYGFWRSGFVALIPWIYSSTTSDPMNYLTGSAMDFLVRHEPDGTPMPVTLWEAFREGHDDYRYVYTLQQLIAAARASDDAEAAAAADAAQHELQWIWQRIQVLPRYQYDDLWPPADFDACRWLIAQQILKLQECTP